MNLVINIINLKSKCFDYFTNMTVKRKLIYCEIQLMQGKVSDGGGSRIGAGPAEEQSGNKMNSISPLREAIIRI